MAREDDSDSRPLGTTPQRVHFGGHRNTCRCALFSREKVNQKSSLGKYHLLLELSYCLSRRAAGVSDPLWPIRFIKAGRLTGLNVVDNSAILAAGGGVFAADSSLNELALVRVELAGRSIAALVGAGLLTSMTFRLGSEDPLSTPLRGR